MVIQNIIPRHIIVLKGIEVNLGNDIDVEYDQDNTFYFGSFNFPDVSGMSFDNLTEEQKKIAIDRLNVFEYRDTVKIYYKEFDNAYDAMKATKEDMNLIVDGYVSDTKVVESRDGAIETAISFRSLMGIAYESSTLYDIPIGQFKNTLFDGLVQVGLIAQQTKATSQSIIDNINNIGASLNNTSDSKHTYSFNSDGDLINTINLDNFTNNKGFVPKATSTTNFGEVLDTIKKNHAIKIFQLPDGTLNCVRPSFFYSEKSTVLQLDAKVNCQNIDFGGIENLYNAVLVYGEGCTGFAFDPIAYELGLPEDLKNINEDLTQIPEVYDENFIPNKKYLRIKHIFKRNIKSPYEANETAINELYRISKTATISLDTIYSADAIPGNLFQLRNSNYVKKLSEKNMMSEDQFWIIKNVKIKISKNDIGMRITGYRNGIADIPINYLTYQNGAGTSFLQYDVLSTLTKESISKRLHDD